jgi:hypothetical protein
MVEDRPETPPKAIRTQSFNVVEECFDRFSLITVAGIEGHCTNSNRIGGSTASTSGPRAARSYFGGPPQPAPTQHVSKQPELSD